MWSLMVRCRVGVACALWLVSFGAARAAAPLDHHFPHDDILGTSLDLTVAADSPAVARECEAVVLAEVERLRRILSTYDPASEISRVNASKAAVPCSAELIEVLSLYDTWRARTGGAYSGQIGQLVQAWRDAERTGSNPDPATLARLVADAARPAWRIDPAARTVTRLTAQTIDVNSLGKGFILQRAAAVARGKCPDVRGLLLDIGGDIATWGTPADGSPHWAVGVADPQSPADNAPPLATLHLRDAAVASSGGYARFHTVAGQRRSHILDPRTGQPADHVLGATVVAPANATDNATDNATANALATSLCVLAPDEALHLIARTPGAHCFITTRDGRHLASPGWAALLAPAAAPRAAAATKPAAAAWPAGHQVSVALTLKRPTRKTHRPYVALWVEDAAGKPIRTVTVWGNEHKYLPELPDWWRFARNAPALVKAVTRATRSAGSYTLAWDGRDDAGNAVAPGTYTLRLEVNREKGRHVSLTTKVRCDADKSTATFPESPETAETQITFGPKPK